MDCTTSCRLPSHAYAILSAITREDLATFKTVLKRICSNSANLTDRLGRHAIHIAASCGKIEILEWLIEECKVNVELRDQENGWTALHRCLFYGQLNCAEILLQHGANLYALDKEDLTPLDLLLLDSPFKLSTSVDAKVIASYDTKLDDELCLHMGDKVANIHMSGPSYWTGNLNGTRGFFPKSCVELIRQDYRSDLFTWGTNTNFTLGHQDESLRQNPEMIETFSTDKTTCIIEVVMCKFHSVFLSQDGKVFTCGHGPGGRLGHGNEQTQLAPKRVDSLKDHYCVALAAAHNHTIVVTDSGTVFAFGLNDMHQLGHTPAPSQCLVPRMIQIKSWRGKHMIGVSVGQYHSVMFTHNEVYTCGLNIGQLGHLKGEQFVTTPRQVTSLYHKDINIAMVTCSDSATVCATSKGDIFVLSQYSCQKVVTRFLELTRLVVSGGEVELNTNNDIIKHHEKPTLTLLNGNGLVYHWKESYGSLRRCKWLSKKEIVVADITVGKQLYIIADAGELYTCLKSGGDAPVVKPTRSPSSSSNSQERDWDQKEIVTHYDVERCPMVHRGIRIFTDNKSKGFAVLQVDPSTGVKSHPMIGPSTMCYDFKQLLEETVVEDDIHDVNIVVKGHIIPAHKFILACKSTKFHHILKENHAVSDHEDETVKTVKLDDVDYEDVMKYIQDMYSGRLVDDTTLFDTKKTHKPTKHSTTPQQQQQQQQHDHHHPQQHQHNNHQQQQHDNHHQQHDHHHHPQHQHQHNNKQHKQLNNESPTNGLHDDTEIDFELLQDLKSLSLPDLDDFSTMSNGNSNNTKANESAVTPSKNNKKKNEKKQTSIPKKDAKKQTKSTFKGLKFKRANCPEFHDVTIESEDGVQFLCHKCVLIARLDYFRSMLACGWLETSKEMRVLSMPIHSGVLQVVLDYLYTDEAKIVKSNQNIEFIGNVLVIADQLLIGRLREICEAAMTKLISQRNVMELLEFSCVYNANQLKDSCLDFICNNLGSLLEAGYLGVLNKETLELLSKAYKEAIPRMPWRIITPQFDHVFALTPEPSLSPSKRRRSSGRKRSVRSESETEVEADGSTNDEIRERTISETVNDVVFETTDIEEKEEILENEEDDARETPGDEDHGEQKVSGESSEKQIDEGQWYRKKSGANKNPAKTPPPSKTRRSKEQKQPNITNAKEIPKSKPQDQQLIKCPWGGSATSPLSSGLRAIMEQEILTNPASTKTTKTPNAAKGETKGKQSQKQRKKALLLQEKENTLTSPEKEVASIKDTPPTLNPWALPDKTPTPVRSLRELIDQEEKTQRALSKSSLNVSPSKAKTNEGNKDKPANKTTKMSWGLRHLEQAEAKDVTKDDVEPPTSPKSAWQSVSSSPPPNSVSFADILHLQERENTNLTRKKPLNVIQLEDRAIQELLEHYGGRDNACEMITVERVPTVSAAPVWNRKRTESAMKT